MDKKKLAIFTLVILAFIDCKTKSDLNERRDFTRALGLPIFVTILPRHNVEKKTLQLLVKMENLTEKPILRTNLLFFAFDENESPLVPEEQKTPELMCSAEKMIPPHTKVKCLVGPYVYTKVWNLIRIQSISFTTEDSTRHFINEDDLDDVTEWY